jgi:hypothetical protein
MNRKDFCNSGRAETPPRGSKKGTLHHGGRGSERVVIPAMGLRTYSVTRTQAHGAFRKACSFLLSLLAVLVALGAVLVPFIYFVL